MMENYYLWTRLHYLRKLLDTARLLWRLGEARMRGRYVHSGWNGEIPFARYEWRGREWLIPTGPVDDERREVSRLSTPAGPVDDERRQD